MKDYEARFVQWIDSTGGGGWTALSDELKEKPHRINTVGWVIREDDHSVSLVLSLDYLDRENPYSDGLVVIPKFAIVEQKTLT